MGFLLKTAKVVGTPSSDAWAQVHTFRPEEEKLAKSGELVATLSIKGESGLEAVEAGREVLSRLHEEYFGREEDSIIKRLTSAVEKVGAEFTGKDVSVEIVAAIFWEKYAYFCIWGEGKVAIVRNGKTAIILSGAKEGVRSLSGEAREDDVLFLANKGFFDVVDEKTIAKALVTESLDESVEILTPLAHAQKESAALGAVIIKVLKKEGEALVVTKQKEQERKRKEDSSQGPVLFKEKARRILVKVAQRLPARAVYVKSEAPSRRTAISVGVLFLALLAVSIFFGVNQKNLKEFRSSYEDELFAAQNLYQDAVLQKDVDPSLARQSFLSAEEKVRALMGQNIKDPRIEELAKNLEEKRVELLGEVNAQTEVLVDLSLIRSDLAGVLMKKDEERVLVLDAQEDRLVEFDVFGKGVRVLSGRKQIGEAVSAGLYGKRSFVYSEKGVVEVLSSESGEVVVEPDDEWGNIVELALFGGNIYLLDRGSSQVWRYPAAGSGWGAKQKWFGPGVSPDLFNVASWAIDGSVWLLFDNGKILKFTRGAPDSFRISGVDGFSKPQAIFTEVEAENLYVLDSGAGAVFAFAKSGEFKRKYLFPEAKEATSIVVSEKDKKLLILTGSRVLQVPLE